MGTCSLGEWGGSGQLLTSAPSWVAGLEAFPALWCWSPNDLGDDSALQTHRHPLKVTNTDTRGHHKEAGQAATFQREREREGGTD